MGLQGPSDLVLAFARVLHINGESTDDTLASAERLSNRLGLRVRIIPRWGELHLADGDEVARLVSVATADPTGVDMDRVASAVRAIDRLSSSLRLVAVCPCMILVPGPHVLNGMMDLAAVRVPLGASRLIYAGLVILVISAGMLLGLGVLGVSLPVDPPGRPVPLWLDMIAAGVAVAAYSIFFSTPFRMLGWPVAVGMLATWS